MSELKSSNDRLGTTWLQRVSSTVFKPIKIPGWLAVLYVLFQGIPDWKSRIDFWLEVVKNLGGYWGSVATILLSPYFSFGIAITGALWLIFVGEPNKGVQRHHAIKYIGTSIFYVCLTTIILTIGHGYFEVRVSQEVSRREENIQKQAIGTPVFWRLTDYQKEALNNTLDRKSESEKFDIQVKCLPDAYSRTFVESFAAVFLNHKWKVSANCLFSDVPPDLIGLYISIPQQTSNSLEILFDKVPENAKKLASILDAADIPFNWGIDKLLKDDEFALTVGNTPTSR